MFSGFFNTRQCCKYGYGYGYHDGTGVLVSMKWVEPYSWKSNMVYSSSTHQPWWCALTTLPTGTWPWWQQCDVMCPNPLPQWWWPNDTVRTMHLWVNSRTPELMWSNRTWLQYTVCAAPLLWSIVLNFRDIGAELRRSRGAQELRRLERGWEWIQRSGDAVIVDIPAKEYMWSTMSIYMRKQNGD